MNRVIVYPIVLLFGISATNPVPADEPPTLIEQLKRAVGAAIEQATQPSESTETDADAESDDAKPNDAKRDGAESNDTKPTDQTSVTWHATLAESVDAARASGKPIFAIVGAPWCSFCEKLQGELEGNPETELAEKWVLAKINADDEVNEARELNANALPALRLLSSDGIVTVSRDGYLPVGELKRWLDDSYELTKARMPSASPCSTTSCTSAAGTATTRQSGISGRSAMCATVAKSAIA